MRIVSINPSVFLQGRAGIMAVVRVRADVVGYCAGLVQVAKETVCFVDVYRVEVLHFLDVCWWVIAIHF